jgi:hypothetical protein
MDKNDRFTDQAFKKVTDQKVIDEAKLKAEQLRATGPSTPKDKKIS